MQTLIKYTRDYLFEKFKEDMQQQPRSLVLPDASRAPTGRRESVSSQHPFAHGVSRSPEQRIVHPGDGRLIGHRHASSLGGSVSHGLDRDPQLGSGERECQFDSGRHDVWGSPRGPDRPMPPASVPIPPDQRG